MYDGDTIMSGKIKCDKCKQEWEEEKWTGKTHEILDEFDMVHQFDICLQCEHILMMGFLKEATVFFGKSSIKSWRMVPKL